VRQQRERARFAFGVAHQQVHEAGLQAQAGLVGRLLDRRPQRVAGQRRHQVQAALGEVAELGIDGEARQVVRPHHDHRRAVVAGDLGDPGADVAHDRRGAVEHEQLLELVDDQHGGFGAGDRGVDHRHWVGAGHDHGRRPAPAGQRRHEPGPHQRGLATS
jgi:hypothetical protein